MADKKATTWGGTLKENVIWFIFAVILAFSASFFNSRTTTVRIQADIQNLQRRVENVEEQTEINSKKVTELQEDFVRLEGKIDRLLRAHGIDTDNNQ